jgi:hypothetical protein
MSEVHPEEDAMRKQCRLSLRRLSMDSGVFDKDETILDDSTHVQTELVMMMFRLEMFLEAVALVTYVNSEVSKASAVFKTIAFSMMIPTTAVNRPRHLVRQIPRGRISMLSKDYERT